jgi:hypothetical protein
VRGISNVVPPLTINLYGKKEAAPGLKKSVEASQKYPVPVWPIPNCFWPCALTWNPPAWTIVAENKMRKGSNRLSISQI